MIENNSKLIFNAIYADGHFEKVCLGKLINKGGAAGKIYQVEDQPQNVAKVFYNLSKSNTNRKKLENTFPVLMRVALPILFHFYRNSSTSYVI